MFSCLTIGNFDGVHRGHQALINRVTERKRSMQHNYPTIKSVVISFDPHPLELLKAPLIVKRLSLQAAKIKIIEGLGIDWVHLLSFDTELSQKSAQDFFRENLLRQYNPKFIAVGPNFHFGRNREGNPQLLQQWCKMEGIECEILEPIQADGENVSSSRIRKLIEEGQMIQAGRLLGRDYSLTGEVIHGNKQGRLLGFPTANLAPQTKGIGSPVLPSYGVYLTHSTVEGRTFASVTNVGVKPTVQDSGPLLLETHLLDFDGDLYGKQLTVEFRDRLRSEMKFSGLPELIAQIRKDTELARLRLRNS